jgi:hypothetical protein
MEEILKRVDELNKLATQAKRMGIIPKNGFQFTPYELDELFENRQLIREVRG